MALDSIELAFITGIQYNEKPVSPRFSRATHGYEQRVPPLVPHVRVRALATRSGRHVSVRVLGRGGILMCVQGV